MQRGSAGARVLRVGLFGRVGVGLWGAAGTSFRAMTAYRQLSSLCGRRLQGIGKQHRHNSNFGKPKQFRQNTPTPRPRVQPLKPTDDVMTLGTTSRGLNLLILLVGRGTHVKALEELKVLAQLMQSLLHVVGRQCKLQTAERIRRGLQLYSVYSRLWGEEAARAVLKSIRRTLVARGRGLLLSAVCFSQYDWEAKKISDDCLKCAVRDLDSVDELLKATVECDGCGKRQIIDKRMGNIDYCMCEGELGYTNTSRVYESWEPFIERNHHIVWRKRHHVHQHLFAYKVYGSYDDVSLSAFMEVHLNSDFRTEWDETALQLRVLDSHKESNSDLIYWLVKYPQFFSNRDYVYKRRFLWNKDKREVVIMSEAVDPKELVPEEKGVHRVNEYWSTMVIRAKEDENKPGLEYTLTYFDNPGTSLPQWLTNFIAVTGFPSFLEKLHNAAVSLQAIHEKGQDVYTNLPNELRYARPVLEKPDVQELFISDVLPTEDITVAVAETTEVTKLPSKEITLYSNEDEDNFANMKSADHSEDTVSPIIVEMETPKELNVSQDLIVMESPKIDLPSEEEDNTFPEPIIKENETVSETETTLGLGTMVHDYENNIQAGMEVMDTVENQTILASENEDAFSEKIIKEVLDSDNITSLALDKALQVHRRNRTVTVDILEAMEVVAPDLDEPTTLSKNIEKFTLKALEELEKNTVLSEKLAKLKNRFKMFQEHASQKKEISIQKMYELERRSHYENYDPVTRMHLDKLFEAMQEVLQADIDMRTGKGLLQNSPDDVFDFKEPFKSFFVRKMETMNTDCKSSESSQCEMATGSLLPKTKSNKNDCGTSKKMSKSKDDPPPPPPPSASTSQHSESTRSSNISQETDGNIEATNNEIETYNGMNSSSNNLINGTGPNTWKSWIYVPYLSEWWVSDTKTLLTEGKSSFGSSSITQNAQFHKGCEEFSKSDISSSSQSIATQVWYIVGLGWIFSAKEVSIDISEVSADESRSSRNTSNAERDDAYKWYWYPVDGAYRLYAWAFKSTNANA